MDIVLVGILGLILLVFFIVSLSVDFEIKDLKPYLCEACFCFRKNPITERSHLSSLSDFDATDFENAEEIIDFRLQRASDDPLSNSNWVPKCLKMDPLLYFERSCLHFSEGEFGTLGNVTVGVLHEPDGSQKRVMVRKMNGKCKEKKEFFNELVKYHDIKNDNIIKLIGIDYIVSPYLAMFEYCEIGDLKSFLINLDERERIQMTSDLMLSFCRDIVNGLKTWHLNFTLPVDFGARTCHVTNSFTIKIGDDGTARRNYPEDYVSFSKISGGTSLTNQSYPIRWLPPEILELLSQKKSVTFITRQNNIWSLGVVLWEILYFGETPFKNMTDEEILSQSPEMYPKVFSEEHSGLDVLREVVLVCLKKNPRGRPSIFSIDKLIKHFLSGNGSFKMSDAF